LINTLDDTADAMVCTLSNVSNGGNFEIEIEWRGSGEWIKTGIYQRVFDQSVVRAIEPKFVYAKFNL
jgi:hypothetical protein